MKELVGVSCIDLNDQDEKEQEYMTEEERGFEVTDDIKAEWCLKKIQEANAEMAKWVRFYDEQIRKAKDRAAFRVAYLEHLLRPYFDSVPKKETKTQASYQLPSGKLVMKAQKPEWAHDDTQLLPWVKNNLPGYVKVKESVDWMELKKELSLVELQAGDGTIGYTVVNADGEIVPGVTAVERDPVFKVEVKE